MDSVPVLENIESFIDRTGAKITYGGKQACYRPGLDDIPMPDRGGSSAKFAFTALFFIKLGIGKVQRYAWVVT